LSQTLAIAHCRRLFVQFEGQHAKGLLVEAIQPLRLPLLVEEALSAVDQPEAAEAGLRANGVYVGRQHDRVAGLFMLSARISVGSQRGPRKPP
jgi:hypothetical protein